MPVDELHDRLAAVPHPAPTPNWLDVERRAHGRHVPRWRTLAIAAAALLAVAAPTLAMTTDGIPFVGGDPAPTDVQATVAQDDVDAPAAMAPQALAAQTRVVAHFTVPGGKVVPVYVAPTRRGGSCTIVPGFLNGCHNPPYDSTTVVVWGAGLHNDAWVVTGDVWLGSGAQTLEASWTGGQREVPLVRVSAPIDQGFFQLVVPQEVLARRLDVTLVVRDGDGQELGRSTVPTRVEYPGR